MLYSMKKDTGFSPQFLAAEKKFLVKKIENMDNLPVPNTHIMELMMMVRNDECEMDPLIEKIEHDQSLVAEVLKLINSGYYGMKQKIDKIGNAVVLLGMLTIKKMVFSASVRSVFSKDEEAEWNHSYSTSVLIERIVQEKKINVSSNISMVMLLHDIGKVALRRFNPKKYELATLHSLTDKISIHRVERTMIQLNHCDVSSILLDKWNMQDDIKYMVENHHAEEMVEEYVTEIALMQFVNWIDATIRGNIVFPPTGQIMKKAGLFELYDEVDYWKEIQMNFIKENEEKTEIKPSKDIVMLEEDAKNDITTKIMKRIPEEQEKDTSTKYIPKLKDKDAKNVEDTTAMRIKHQEENAQTFEEKLKDRVQDVDKIIEEKAKKKVEKISETSSLRLKLFNKLKGK